MRTARLLLWAAATTGLACATPASQKATARLAAQPQIIARAEQERAAPSAFQEGLASKDPLLRVRAVTALARLEHASATPSLLRAMNDVDPRVRAEAAFGLGQLDAAFAPSSDAHQAARGQVERRLIQGLYNEGDAVARRAVVRALGRVADSAGLDALISLSMIRDAVQGEAFIALGVSGARRKSSRAQNVALLASVAAGLTDPDERVRGGAAYAAFRQKLALPLEVLRAAAVSSDVQTRIFIMRAAPSQDEGGAQALIDVGLKDADWRVRSEALRAASSRPQNAAAMAAVIDAAVTGLATSNDAPGAALGHVVREACMALAATGVGPAEAAPALQRAVATLAPLPQHRAAACACAVSLDVVAPGGDAISRCSASQADPSSLVLLRVKVASLARVPSDERVALLVKLSDHDDVKVRMAAAAALVEVGSPAAAAAAALLLADEEDAATATTLLELFSPDAPAPDGGALGELLPDSTLFAMVERLRAAAPGKPYDKVEPLVAIAAIARARTTPTSQAITAELSGHPELRVKDAAMGTLPGDRAPGARASVIAAPPAATLPLYAKLTTARGDIRIAFDRDHAPATVANFVALARAKFYAGTPFHRVIADFVAQGGDPRGDGSGGPGYSIACENSDESYTRGAVGMATAGKDTGGSQFFLTHSHQPHLDGRYTLFARVVDGLAVMDALQPGDVLLSIDFLGAAPTR